MRATSQYQTLLSAESFAPVGNPCHDRVPVAAGFEPDGGSQYHPPAVQRRTYLFGGRVQGVGFRYTAQHIARGHPVKGYVRNLPDGRVEMVMEGEDNDMDAVLASLKQEMSRNIQRVDVSRTTATGEFPDFSVRP